MNQQAGSDDRRSSTRSESFDLFEMLVTIWSGKWLVVAIAGIGAAIAVAYVLLATPWYRAEVLLIPAEEQATSGLLTQLGGLAGLAGVSVGVNDSTEPLAVLRSQGFARQFIDDEGLLTVILADEWDANAKAWKESDPQSQPDWRDAVEEFDEEVRSVTEDMRTGLITVAINWTDAELAAQWANRFVERLNDRMRRQALEEAESNLKYLQAELAKTSVVSVQQAIGRLLDSELQKSMLARGKLEFALRVIDRAETPREPSSPRRLLVLALSVLASGLLGTVFVLLRHTARRRFG